MFADSFREGCLAEKRSNRNARMIQVRHRSHATYSRQPRQVRKEATVTGSCVGSEVPVSDFFISTLACHDSDYSNLHFINYSFRKKRFLGASIRSRARLLQSWP